MRSLLCFLLVFVSPVTSFKLTTPYINPGSPTQQPLIPETSDPLIGFSRHSTPELVSSSINQLSKNSTPHTVKTILSECDDNKKVGVVTLIGFNHLGIMKGNYILQITSDTLKHLQSKGVLIRLIIDDSAPTRSDSTKKDWVLTSMVRKLGVDTFTPARAWEMNIFGFLFVDKTMDFSDPMLRKEMRRLIFHDIYLYMVIVGDGVDMAVVNRFLSRPDRAIFISSYDELPSSLPSKLVEKLCVRRPQSTFHIA